MAQQFYTILTKIGAAKIANAVTLGTKVNITQLAAGDGNGAYYNPTDIQTTLVHEVWRGAIQSLDVDADNQNWIVVQVDIPSSVGGFMVREAGIFDDEGDMIAIGVYPETYKPLVTDGSAKDLYLKMIIQVSNTSVITLKIDPAVVLATKNDVNAVQDNLNAHKTQIASSSALGHIKGCSGGTIGEDGTLIITPATVGAATAEQGAKADTALQTSQLGQPGGVAKQDDFAAHQADYAQDTGVANAYKITLTPAPTAYEIGKIYKFKAVNTNTGASTFQINTLAVTPIKKNVTMDLVSGDIVANQIASLVYDGTNFQFIGITQSERIAWNNKLDASSASSVAGKVYAYKNLGGGL